MAVASLKMQRAVILVVYNVIQLENLSQQRSTMYRNLEQSQIYLVFTKINMQS